MGKLQCFRSSGRGEGWRLMAALIPLMAATYVGLSRFQDCRHHWDGKPRVGKGVVLMECTYLGSKIANS